MTKFYEEIDQLKFCIFDLETTGGNQDKDEIIEIGIALVENFKITDEKNFLLKPKVKIPEFIQKLTSISNDDVKGCPKIEEVIDEILSMMKGRILVAHNTSFDVPFFNSVLRRLGKEELPNKSICTNLMSKYLIPNLLNTNLSYMSNLFKIDHGNAHRALDDARATAKIFLIFLQIFKNRKIEKLNHLYYPKNKFEIAKKIDTIMDSEKNLFPNVDFYGGLLLHELGFLTELFTPIFVAGRTAGWAAHYFEQRQQDTLLRPAAKYIGPSER